MVFRLGILDGDDAAPQVESDGRLRPMQDLHDFVQKVRPFLVQLFFFLSLLQLSPDPKFDSTVWECFPLTGRLKRTGSDATALAVATT